MNVLKLGTIVLILSTTGCAISPSCYVGISIFPPGPFIHCGVTTEKKDDEKRDRSGAD